MILPNFRDIEHGKRSICGLFIEEKPNALRSIVDLI